MAKIKFHGIEIPKRVLGFKLSKGTRKDLRKLLKRIGSPEARTLMLSAAGVAAGYLAEQAAKRDDLIGRVTGKVAPPPRPN